MFDDGGFLKKLIRQDNGLACFEILKGKYLNDEELNTLEKNPQRQK